MKLSTNSGVHSARIGKERYTMLESIRFCADVGFDTVDINFCGTIFTDPYKIDPTIIGENWENDIYRVAEEAQRLHLCFPTSHLPFYNFASSECEDREFKDKMVERAIEASALLGVKWAVLHPGLADGDMPDFQKSKNMAIEYIKPFLEMAGKFGIGIAVENMPGMKNGQKAVRYCCNPQELCDLVDTLGEGAGICWDFGHANLTDYNQEDSLRKMGRRLKVTHVHDNNGLHDEHLLPHMGKIQWEPLMRALREIGYEGDFNYEVTVTNIPEELRKVNAEYLVAAGKRLLTFFDD